MENILEEKAVAEKVVVKKAIKKKLTKKELQEKFHEEHFSKLTNHTLGSQLKANFAQLVPTLPLGYSLTHYCERSVYNYAWLFLRGSNLVNVNHKKLVKSAKLNTCTRTVNNAFVSVLTGGSVPTRVLCKNGTLTPQQCNANRGRSFEEFYLFLNSKFKTITPDDAYAILKSLYYVNYYISYRTNAPFDPLNKTQLVLHFSMGGSSMGTCSTISRVKIVSYTTDGILITLSAKEYAQCTSYEEVSAKLINKAELLKNYIYENRNNFNSGQSSRSTFKNWFNENICVHVTSTVDVAIYTRAKIDSFYSHLKLLFDPLRMTWVKGADNRVANTTKYGSVRSHLELATAAGKNPSKRYSEKCVILSPSDMLKFIKIE